MPIFLAKRNEKLTEWMDKDDCDKELLFNTYRQFHRINRLLSGWNTLYNDYIKPVIINNGGSATILDIGCGGGDIIRHLYQRCKSDQFDVSFTGIDPDKRAFQYVEQTGWPDEITFLPIHSEQLIEQGKSFDIVISNHLLHHLDEKQLLTLCSDSERLANRRILFSDIERSDIGYLAFSLIAPMLFRNSYIVKDGLISIRRSYRKPELEKHLPDSWSISRRLPFRLIATYDKE